MDVTFEVPLPLPAGGFLHRRAVLGGPFGEDGLLVGFGEAPLRKLSHLALLEVDQVLVGKFAFIEAVSHLARGKGTIELRLKAKISPGNYLSLRWSCTSFTFSLMPTSWAIFRLKEIRADSALARGTAKSWW